MSGLLFCEKHQLIIMPYVTDNILSVTLILYIIRVHRLIHIPRDIILPVYMYLLYLLDGTVEAWMKSSVFIHLTQLPSNPIIFGFGRLALRCDFSKTKIQPLTLQLDSFLLVVCGNSLLT